MIFVNVNNDRKRLRTMTRLLSAMYPGSVIYEYTDPMMSVKEVLDDSVDVVLAEANMRRVDGMTLLQVLRKHKPGIPICILSDTDKYRRTALARGANAYLTEPVSKKELRDTIEKICVHKYKTKGTQNDRQTTSQIKTG